MAATHDPAWPDKALFAALLLLLAGLVGVAFELTRPLVAVDQDRLPVLFTDELRGYTLGLSAATAVLGLLALRRQSALFVYLGALAALLSLGVFGLVPGLAVVAVGFMLKSHAEGEETRLDGHHVPASAWPDKAMAACLLLVVLAGIALTQAVLVLAGRFDPLVLTAVPVLAGLSGLAVAAIGFAAAREVYRLERPWLGWLAFLLGVTTFGFYLLGPAVAAAGLVLLWLAHREHEFGTRDPAGPPLPAALRIQRRRRRAA